MAETSGLCWGGYGLEVRQPAQLLNLVSAVPLEAG